MSVLITFFAILSIAIVFLVFKPTKKPPLNLPPGPKGLPFIGNLHQFDPSKLHIYFTDLAKIYGPILSLRMGRVPIVVVNSAKIAKEVFQAQDLNFCSRPQLVGVKRLTYNGLDIAFAPYNDYYREIKKISVVHLLSSKKVESFSQIRQEEVEKMIDKIKSLSSGSNIINLTELLTSFVCSNICRIAFGQRCEDNELGSRSRFHTLLIEVQAMLTAFFFTDYLPLLGWLDYLTGKLYKLEKTYKTLDEFYEEIINNHLDPNKPQMDRENIIDVLLHLKKNHSFELSLVQIKAVLMTIFVAGTDTSSAMVIWAMSELLKHPTSMKKVQEELRKINKNNGGINQGDLTDLKYFKAVIKETLRLHPATPLIVREAIRKSTVEGYDILAKTTLYINAWAIGRDPTSWKDPEKFMPERFLESSIDYKGYNFELVPFGAGRRICPGLALGVGNMEVALANILYHFDWELPSESKREHIEFDVLPGITMQKKTPLCLYAKAFNK